MLDLLSFVFPLDFFAIGAIVLGAAYFFKKDLIFWGAIYVAIWMVLGGVRESSARNVAPLVTWTIMGLMFLAVAIYRGGRVPQAPSFVKVGNKTELLTAVQMHAAQGYATVMDRGNIIVMNKKVPFNWLLCIILLFIPVIGWIAMLFLLFADKNKISTVTIEAPETAGT